MHIVSSTYSCDNCVQTDSAAVTANDGHGYIDEAIMRTIHGVYIRSCCISLPILCKNLFNSVLVPSLILTFILHDSL